MEKNWLIRTKSNHILGPITKEKVIELYQNGSIKPDDEVTTGNGFWFFIRESDLVDKYLTGNDIQSFNPISEAKDVLTSHPPTQEDPHESSQGDHTRVGGIKLSDLKDESDEPKAAAKSESQTKHQKNYMPIATPEDKAGLNLEVPEKKKVNSEQRPNASTKYQKPPGPKQGYFPYLAFFLFVLLCLLVYFRNVILYTLFELSANLPAPQSLILESAHAQEDTGPVKKKAF